MSSPLPSGALDERRLFEADTGSFELPLRQLLVRLLRGPYLDGVAEPRLWQLVLDRRTEISAYVSEIFLLLEIDTNRKIAVLSRAHHSDCTAPRPETRGNVAGLAASPAA